MNLIKKILFSAGFFALFLLPFSGFALERVEVHFFGTKTCPHCIDENNFLTGLEKEYSDLQVFRYSLENYENQVLLQDFAKRYGAERYLGVVPITFIGDEYFVGFDDEDGVGRQIKSAILKQMGITEEEEEEAKRTLRVPFLGNVDISRYSFLFLAVILGLLDGFNVCSLAALVLILGLVLALKSRKKILLYGGTFVFTTSVVYGLLIIFWYKVFSYFSSYVRVLETAVGVLAILASVFFVRQFIRFKKYGPTCGVSEGDGLISRFFKKIQGVFESRNSVPLLFFSVFLFALVVAVVEFPCSAAMPVVFAGALAEAQLPALSYVFYIALFVLFYMLDEFVVFLVAVFKMNVWVSSPKFTIWATLIEALVLAIMGFYYLAGVI